MYISVPAAACASGSCGPGGNGGITGLPVDAALEARANDGLDAMLEKLGKTSHHNLFTS
jgi:hypothetical protein